MTAATWVLAGIMWLLGALVALAAVGTYWAGKGHIVDRQARAGNIADKSAGIIRGAAVAAVVAAVESGELTEAQGGIALGVDRVTMRKSQDEVIKSGRELYNARRLKLRTRQQKRGGRFGTR